MIKKMGERRKAKTTENAAPRNNSDSNFSSSTNFISAFLNSMQLGMLTYEIIRGAGVENGTRGSFISFQTCSLLG